MIGLFRFSNYSGINIDNIFPESIYYIYFSIFWYKIMHNDYELILLSIILIIGESHWGVLRGEHLI